MSTTITPTTGNTFSNGDSATATKLNNQVNAMTVVGPHNGFWGFDGTGATVDGTVGGGLSMASGVLSFTGVATVAQGGTGVSTLTSTGILVAHGTSAVTASTNLTTDGAGNVTQAGNLNFSTAGGGCVGDATGTGATIGNVGYSSGVGLASVSAIALTTNTPVNVVSHTFPAGNFAVWGNVWFQVGAGLVATTYVGAISAASATLPGIDSASETQTAAAIAAPGVQGNLPITAKVFRSSIGFTLYLVSSAAFSGGSVSTFGGISWLQLQ